MPSVIKVDQIQSDTGNVAISGNVSSTLRVSNTSFPLIVRSGGTNHITMFDTRSSTGVGTMIGANQDGNTYYDSNYNATATAGGHIWRSGGSDILTLGATGLLTTTAGIKFPATQNASADANTLDDYEEGTCSIFLTDLTNNTSTTTQSYIKIGKFVTVAVSIYNLSISGLTAGSHIYLSGMPFSQDASGLNPHDILSSPLLSLPVILAHRDTAGRAALYVSQSGDRVNWGTLTRTVWGGNNISLYGNICYYANA